ncbi:hypothetical protein AwDysgo_16260 [Bacteroidales bacterium]|nr:hypothetical protein AwDysgo_16260 [Bacteroidales bacterium]
MKLIADSSSTKTEWCLVEGIYVIEHALTEGMNPFFQKRREISRCIRLQLPEIFFKKKIDQIYYYGAGCSSEEKRSVLRGSLLSQFRSPTEVESDLLGAARALFLEEPGIACILGTGSNSCFYDGSHIVKNVKSLGYVLGDEGSGSALGRMFLSDYLRNLAPSDIAQGFSDQYGIGHDEILNSIYSNPFPNRFMAACSSFLIDFIDTDYVQTILTRNFKGYFTRNILQYDHKNYPIRFVGSMAFKYADVLRKVAQGFDIEIDRIEATSIAGLVEYHTKHCRLETLSK